MIDAHEALARVRQGNRRFASGSLEGDRSTSPSRRVELIHKQEPFAIILGCSDSRVPAEIVFDQGLGDLFVIRVAGNIVAPTLVESIEFAAERFGTRLVVVLGHTSCGAVDLTVTQLLRQPADPPRDESSIVARVRPSVEPLLATDLRNDRAALVSQAVRANVNASVNHLRHASGALKHLIQHEGLLVVGAEYSLETGVVDFFD